MNKYEKIGVGFCKRHFNIDLFNYQKPIISNILNKSISQLSIRACTRAGKSYTVALSAIAYASIYSNSKIGIIAPSKEKTKIIMNYIAELLSISDLEGVIDLDVMQLTKLERLKREVSKNKITFKNGSYIQILTADVKGKGFSLMGAAFDLIITDEVAELPKEVYSKIYRMKLQNNDAKLVELGNPWFLNHFYEHSLDPDWLSIKIDYNKCLAEGRFTQEQVDDQRKELSDSEFRVLLEAEFPSEITNSLFKYDDLVRARRKITIPKKEHTTILGVDVARMGEDSTIIYKIHKYESLFVVVDKIKFSKLKLTETAGKIIQILENDKIDIIRLDSTGLGSGLDDMLQEHINNNDLDTKFESIVFSEKANDEHNLNRKADIFFNLVKMFSENQVIIPEDDNELFLQLRRMLYEYTSNAKKKIDDNQEKSPDCADALAIACYHDSSKNIIIDLG